MDTILRSLPVYMMIGIVLIVGISQLNRIIGSVLGIAFWIAVAVVGTLAYDQGGGIRLLSLEFSRSGFIFFCGLFVAFNVFNLYKALQRRNRYLARRSSSDLSDEQ